MSQVKGKNTTPEKTVRSLLHRLGFRFRLHKRTLPGTPDIILPKYHSVIFVHGCFWHRHNCPNGQRLPKTNVDFWKNKIERNKERDLRERIKLRDMGWHVIQFWECQLKPSVRNENLNGLLFTLNHLFLENFAVRHAVLYGEGSRELNLIAAEDETEYEKNKPL